MVDAKREYGTLKWSNGKDFQPNCVECIEHTIGELKHQNAMILFPIKNTNDVSYLNTLIY